MALRKIRLRVAFTYHTMITLAGLILTFLGYIFNFTPVFEVGALVILFHLLMFRLLPFDRLFQQWRIRHFTCNVCNLTLDLFNHWNCKGKSCGYTTERHLFSPCPQCGKGFAWLNCPRCETSHLI